MILGLIEEMKINKFLVFKKIVLLFFLLNITQSCTSSVEVAATLGKKYLITKDNNKINPNPVYKVGNKYKVKGKFYYPKKDMFYNKTGIASWYGPKFHGKLTANGEIYNQNALTAAHKTLPLPSSVKVTNLKNNKSLILRINDRGPFVGDRIIDLSYKSAQLLGIIEKGTGKVRVEIIDYGEHLLVKNIKKPLKTNVKKNKEYFLQVGVFKEASNADRLSDKIRNIDYINYKVTTNTSNIEDRVLYIVKIGPINNNENVKYVQRKLKKDEINTKVIIE